MCISEKRGRHSQSYVEVILSIENVSKMYQKCVPDGRLQPKKIDVRMILFASTSNVVGSRTPGGAVKVCIICLWARLVRSWYQLGATWIQLGPNLALISANMCKLTLK